MRILLITEVFPPQTGGSGRWFWEIYRRLDASKTTVLAGAQPGDEAFDRTHDLDVRRAPMSFPTWGIANRTGLACYRELARRVERLIALRRPEQLHCGKVLPEGFVAWWLGRKLKIPYLIYVHGEELNIAAGSRELSWMTNRVLRSAERVIANSENTAGLLREDWGVSAAQLQVLHPGVDTDRFRPADPDPVVRRHLNWNDRPVILTVGRLQKRKGQDQLIRAIPKLVQSHPNLLYSIVGDGPERDSLDRLVAELGVARFVDFRGEVSDEEMVNCYQQCDIFVLPNRTVDGDFEGFGMVLLEAQACGRPVIAGASGGTSEAMQDGQTGYVVDCSSIEALTESLNALLANSTNRNAMGDIGRGLAESSFAWDSLVSKAIDTFGKTTNAPS